MMDQEAAISVRDLWVSYEQKSVLEAINLSVARGEIVSIVGPNGSGKTTLLNVILGFKEAVKGSVSLFGHSPEKARRKGEIGYLPQNVDADSCFPVTARDTVAMARHARNLFQPGRGKTDRRIVEWALERVEMTKHADSHFGSLSGGQQQRVLIARALALQPRILLLDEPSTGLDLVAQDSFYSLLQTLRDEKQLAILMVSHDIGTVSGVVDRIACLNRRIHFHGPAEDCIPSEALEKVFGANVQFVLHDKNCDTCGKVND